MFEVEKKLREEESARLLEGAEFVGEKNFTDTYYDTEDYALTKNDIWLRRRGGAWELKLPMHDQENKLTRQYQEIEGEEKIREVFSLPPLKDFLSDINDFGYSEFYECKTTGKKHEKNSFEQERKKMLDYLKLKKPEHFQALIEAGVAVE